MRIGRIVASMVAVAALVATPLTVPTAAHADGVTGLAFQGFANLPTFPCPAEPGSDGCEANFGGIISGQLGGDKLGRPWTATLADAPLEAHFTYSDTCAQGTAEGTVTIYALAGDVAGTFDTGQALPSLVVGLWAQADFTWERTGASAVVTLTNGSVRLNVSGMGWIEMMTDGLGAGAATFAPDITTGDPPECVDAASTPPLRAVVAGTTTLADPR